MSDDFGDDEDVKVYAGIANRLTGLLSTWTEYEAALKVAIPATERLKSLGRDTLSEYTNMLIFIGCAQSRWTLEEGDFILKVGNQTAPTACTKTKIWDTPNI